MNDRPGAQLTTAAPPLPAAARSLVFTSDLLKVDDRLQKRLPNPQEINVEWVHALFAPLLTSLLGRPAELFAADAHPNPLSRLSLYRRLGREFSSAGWASLYDELGDEEVEDAIAERFAGSLVIAFEMPPYLERILRRAGIGFIDLSIHPVRYLPDYMFGVRSNIPEVSRRLHATQVPPSLFGDFARLSAARTARIYRNNLPEPGSALFLGQIEIDSSLIWRGRLHGEEDTELALTDLVARFPQVYFKAHPHRSDTARERALVESMPRCSWLEVNIYDVLARPEIALAASLSSGSLTEAGIFGRETRRYVARPSLVDVTGAPHEEVFLHGRHVAAPPAIFRAAWWAHVLGITDEVPAAALPDPTASALRTSLNQKWGR